MPRLLRLMRWRGMVNGLRLLHRLSSIFRQLLKPSQPSSSEKESRSLPRRCQNQWALGLLSPFDAGHASRLSPRIMSFCVTSYNLHVRIMNLLARRRPA